jgi:hypothetical protein
MLHVCISVLVKDVCLPNTFVTTSIAFLLSSYYVKCNAICAGTRFTNIKYVCLAMLPFRKSVVGLVDSGISQLSIMVAGGFVA